MEVIGGQGVYGFISGGALHLKVVKNVRFGGVLLLGFFMYFWFFYH